MLYAYDSRPFLAVILSAAALASSANCSASRTMRSMSSLERRPLSLVMVMLAFFARGTLVLGRDVQHTIGIDIECDLDLRHATRGRRDPSELELAEHVVVLGAGSLAFVNLDEHARLVVGVGGEGLGLLGWDGGVTSDEGGHHTTSSLEAKGQRGNIEEQQVGVASGASSEHTGLDSRTVGDSLIRVDGASWLFAVEEARDELVDLGDTGGATDHDDLVNGALVNLGVAEHLLDRLESATEEVSTQVLEASTGDGRVEVDRPWGYG